MQSLVLAVSVFLYLFLFFLPSGRRADKINSFTAGLFRSTRRRRSPKFMAHFSGLNGRKESTNFVSFSEAVTVSLAIKQK